MTKPDIEAVKAEAAWLVKGLMPLSPQLAPQYWGHVHLLAALLAHCAETEQRLAAAAEVLKPFARLADSWEAGHHRQPSELYDNETIPGRYIKLGHVRAARALLPPADGGEHG